MSVNGFTGPRRTGQLIDRRAESTPDQRARCVALLQQKVGAPVGKITRRRSVYPDQGYCGAINLNNLKPVHHGYATVISLWHLVCRITIDAGQLFLPTNAATGRASYAQSHGAQPARANKTSSKWCPAMPVR